MICVGATASSGWMVSVFRSIATDDLNGSAPSSSRSLLTTRRCICPLGSACLMSEISFGLWMLAAIWTAMGHSPCLSFRLIRKVLIRVKSLTFKNLPAGTTRAYTFFYCSHGAALGVRQVIIAYRSNAQSKHLYEKMVAVSLSVRDPADAAHCRRLLRAYYVLEARSLFPLRLDAMLPPFLRKGLKRPQLIMRWIPRDGAAMRPKEISLLILTLYGPVRT